MTPTPQTHYYYMVHTVLFESLEKFLNNVERLAEGQYDVVSIFEKQAVGSRSEIGVVIRFHVQTELEFDAKEIARRLGFTE